MEPLFAAFDQENMPQDNQQNSTACHPNPSQHVLQGAEIERDCTGGFIASKGRGILKRAGRFGLTGFRFAAGFRLAIWSAGVLREGVLCLLIQLSGREAYAGRNLQRLPA